MQDDVDDYLAQRTAEGASSASIRNYRFRLALLRAFIEETSLTRWQDVTLRQMDTFPLWLRNKRGLAFSSTQAVLATTRTFFGWMALQGRVLSSPAVYLKLCAGIEDEPLLEPPLSEAEVSLILAEMPRRNVLHLRNIALIELLYSAGLRLSEALSLDTSSADMNARVLFVKSAKGGVPRDLPIVRGLHGALADYLALRRMLLRGPDHGALLLAANGKRISTSSIKLLMRTINRAKLCERKVHAHLFRHSIAVHLLRGGADIRYIQQFLGHAMLETTKIYLRLVPADVEAAYHNAMPAFDVHA